MAGMFCSARSAAIAYGAGATKTALIVTAPANHRLVLLQFGFTTNLSSPTAAPGVLTIYKASTAGTTTAITPVLLSAGSETPQATFGSNATAEPTESAVIRQLHIDRGFWESRSFELKMPVPGGTRLAFKIYTPTAIEVLPWIEYEE